MFEILSPTSGQTDLVVKPAEYAAVPSILRYVVIEQRRARVRNFVRISGNAWTETTPLVPGDTLDLPEIGIELPIADINERVAFDP